MNRLARILSLSLTLGTACAGATPFFTAEPVQAQAASFRSMTGTVTNKGGAKLKGAVVHLKDTRSLSQRSYITAEDGVFRFAQLSTNSDYEVWADLDGKKTPSKTVSSFDTKKTVDVALKMPN